MTGLAPVRLEGPRVVVRTSTPGDARRFASYFDRNRAHLAPWESERDPSFYTDAFWSERLRAYDEQRERGDLLRMVIVDREDDGELAGIVSLTEVQRAPTWRARVGYSLDATKQGTGRMSEALGLVVRYAFDVLNLKRLLAGHVPENARSARVLERAGFVREGYYKEYLFVGGAWRDHVDTSLLNPAWRASEK